MMNIFVHNSSMYTFGGNDYYYGSSEEPEMDDSDGESDGIIMCPYYIMW